MSFWCCCGTCDTSTWPSTLYATIGGNTYGFGRSGSVWNLVGLWGSVATRTSMCAPSTPGQVFTGSLACYGGVPVVGFSLFYVLCTGVDGDVCYPLGQGGGYTPIVRAYNVTVTSFTNDPFHLEGIIVQTSAPGHGCPDPDPDFAVPIVIDP